MLYKADYFQVEAAYLLLLLKYEIEIYQMSKDSFVSINSTFSDGNFRRLKIIR